LIAGDWIKTGSISFEEAFGLVLLVAVVFLVGYSALAVLEGPSDRRSQ
jgi:hypothetical protein